MRLVEGGRGTIINSSSQKFVVDPLRKQKGIGVLTHAHKDHARSFLEQTITHPATADLLGKQDLTTLREGKTISFDGSTLSFKNSGHILGSMQALFELEEKRVLVTGDLNPENDLIGEVEPAECDIMVIETTYGRPDYVFPERVKLREDIAGWLEKNSSQGKLSVIGARALGGAQEIVRLANDSTKITPFVTHQIHEYNQVYEKHGVRLGKYECVECSGSGLKEAELAVIPLQFLDESLAQALHITVRKPIALAASSGWMLNARGRKVKGFPLSAHAGFNSLLEYIKQSKPRLVLTHHGFKEEFSRYVYRRLGIPSRPLNVVGQKMLSEFL